MSLMSLAVCELRQILRYAIVTIFLKGCPYMHMVTWRTSIMNQLTIDHTSAQAG